MLVNSTETFVHSKQEAAIIEAIEYVLALRKKAGVKKNLKLLIEDLGVTSANYIQTRSKFRGFTKEKIPTIINKLVDKYGVSMNFLQFKMYPIMQDANFKNTLADDGGLVDIFKEKIKEQQRLIKLLSEQVADKNEIINIQKMVIDSYKNEN